MSEVIADASRRIPRRVDVPWFVEAHRVTIKRRKFGPIRTLLLRLMRMAPDLTLRLDRVGSDAWMLLDGRSVGAVLAKLRELHPKEDDLADRLGRFLSEMVRHGLVRLD